MLNRFSLSLLSCALLAGCGGSGDTSPNNQATQPQPVEDLPLDSKFYGVWTVGELAYVIVSKSALTVVAYDDTNSCFESTLVTKDTTTATSFTGIDFHTDERSTTNFSLNGLDLVMEQDGQTLTFTESIDFNWFPGCASPEGIKKIDIELEMAYLPPSVTINRDAQDTGHVEYEYSIDFDVNHNDEIDPSDVTISLLHFKSSSSYPSNYAISLEDIGGSIWRHFPRHQTDRQSMTSSDRSRDLAQLSQQQNRLLISVDVNQSPLLAHINADTPVSISSIVNYPAPEPEVIATFQDGPWNWTSAKHSDLLPQEGFLTPSAYANFTIDDATNDLTEGESSWADIKSVKFTFGK